MDTSISRYCLPLLLLTAITSAETNGTSDDEPREPRVSGRIVKLYSGAKPEPFLCAGEGFQLDPNNCAAFYRCLKERSGKYTVFQYQCAPGTVYDPDLETCNHPHSTRRIECGGTLKTTSDPRHTTNINEIEGAQSELPQPISTKVPMYAKQTTSKTPSTVSWILSTERQNAPTKMPWESFHSSSNALSTSQTKSPTFTSSKVVLSTHSAPSASILPPRLTQTSSPRSDEPCTSDGFMGDSENCRKFYRCVSNLKGGYAKYEFSCSGSTVWDDEIQGCNHPWAVKRSKCGRSMSYDDNSASTMTGPSTTEASVKDSTVYNGFGYKSNKTIQQQLQVSHGSDVTQIQVQISKSQDVIQNQTQINYGDKIENGDNSKSKQNQTQISYGSAISQSQTQIDQGNKGVQTQLQIDHSKDSSQFQVQESVTQSTTMSTTKNINNGKNECTESGFMGDSNDCKKFYRCVDNGRGYTRYEYSCGDGTLWDPEIEACNHGWAVKNCGGKAPAQSTAQHTTTTEKTTKSSTQHTKTTKSSTTSQIPDTDDEDDVGYGNPNNEDTLPPSTSPSTTSKTTTTSHISTTSTSTTRKPNEATECISSGFMGDANDCKIFYRCVDNGNGGFIKYEFKCGDGTVWDPSIEACNHAWAVKNCGSTGDGHKEETTTKKDNTTPFNNVHTTVTLVQITTQATTTLIEEYDTGYGSQNQEPQESSTAKSTTTSKPTKPSQEPGKGSECESSGFMGDENDCKKFYRCVNNGNGGYIKYEFTCGQGTVWDPKIEACNHAWAVEKCGGSYEDGGHETTSQSSTVQSSTVTESTSAHTTENGKETEIPSTTTSTTSSSTTHSDSNDKCSSSGFLGDISDCKKFYRCVDNGDGSYTRYEFKCGDGTVWDPKIEACNHGWAVEKCGGASQQTTTLKPQQTTQIMKDEEQDSGYPTPSHETSESSQSTTSSSTSGSPTVTPAGEAGICKNNGFMGDTRNCKKFYRCVDNGKGGYDRYEFQCGEGTVWDQSIEACNHAYAVKNCRSSGESGTTHSKDENTTPYVPSSSEHGQVSTEKTTTTTKFHQESGQSLGEECRQEGFYGDKNDCKKFYRCVDNGKGGFTKYEFKCGDGTSWNSDIQNCDHITSDRPCGSGASQHSTTQESTHWYDEMDGQSTSTTTVKSTTTTGNPSNDSSSQTTKKPQSSDGKCSSEGFHANPSDCKKFYRCVDNGNGGYTKYDFSCGDGTVWNQEIQACDHPSGDGSCSSSSSSQHNTSSQSESTTSSQPESTTSSYSTTKREDNTERTKEPTTSGNQCTAEGFYAHPIDCKKFVRCVDNGKGGYTRYEFSCGDGTVWVQEIQACDHDNDVYSCNAQSGSTSLPSNSQNQTSGTSHSDMTTSSTESLRPNKEDDEYSNVPSHDESDDCSAEGYYGNKQDCRKFYRCVDNGKGGYTKYDFVCGEGTAWDTELQTCNHINEVQSCSGSTTAGNGNHQTTTNRNQESDNTLSTTKATTTSGSSSSTPSSNSKDICETEGYFGNSNDCKKFYRCVDNGKGGYTKYDFTCGDGTIWDQDITTCNHPQDVLNPSCGSNQGSEDSSTSSSSSTTSSTTSSSSQTTSSSTGSSTSSQNTSDCSQESSKKPSNDKITCDKAGYYANPSDCKKFYRCVDWDGDGKRFSVFHFECGEGTIWDPALDTCNHEESVYPQRDCQTQSQNVGGETDGTTTTTTEGTTSSTTEETTSTITDEPTTQESSTTKQTTAQQTTSESTTETTTSEKTTTQSTTSEQTTTQQSTTSEKTTTQESTTSEQSTTQPSTTSEPTTTQQPTTNQQTTTEQSTTTEQTTTQQPTTSETTEQQTTEQTTTQQTTSSESTTQKQTTTSITSEQTTQQSTTTQESNTSEQTTEQTTTSENTTPQESTTSGENTTEGSNKPTTEQTTATTEQTTDGTTTTEQSTDGTTTTEQSPESTTEQTTEGTTAPQSTDRTTEETTDGTTEQSTDGTTTAQTTDETTTAESTTEQSTASTESDDQSTTEATSTDKECPETEDDQYVLVCPTSFRRHPKYCNMFYQCTEDEETYEAKMAMFKCPNNTIYDENQTQCVTEDKADKKCDGEIANKRRFKRLGSYYKDPIVADKGKQSCPASGFFPFEKQSECAKGFLKCERSKKGELRGYVYQCPDGYIYWSISKRCEKEESVRDCKRSRNDWSGRWNIPIERHNIARS